MTNVSPPKRSSILIISSGILVCALGLWLLSGQNCASAQIAKGTLATNNRPISVRATGLGSARNVPLYGFNGNNTFGPKWSTPNLLKQIKSIKPQIIRYPGGNVSDWWDWQTGWFINNSDLPTRYKQLSKVSMGLDELKKVIDATGCQVVFVLNMISSSLSDQILMLQHAQQMGIAVKWIELGNEYNIPNSAGMQKFKGAKLYATTSRNWISSIHNYFPLAQIAIVGGNSSNNLISSWNTIVLKETQSANAIVLHNYPWPIKVIDANGINFSLLYNQTNTIIQRKGFNIAKSLPSVWVTEYNILWGNLKRVSNKNQVLSNYCSWGDALGIILMTSTLTQQIPNLEIACVHNLTGYEPFSAIQTKNKTFNLLPNGIGIKAWGQASIGMSTMAQINFITNQKEGIPDYQLLGWKFSKDQIIKAILVNFTNRYMKVDLKMASLTKKISYRTIYANKNQQVIGLKNVQQKNGTTEKEILTLPPYSITNIEGI